MVTTWLARWATFSVTGAAPLAMAHPKRSRLCLYRGQRGEKGDFCGVIANRHVQQGLPLFPVGTDLLRFGILLGIVLQVVLRIFLERLRGREGPGMVGPGPPGDGCTSRGGNDYRDGSPTTARCSYQPGRKSIPGSCPFTVAVSEADAGSRWRSAKPTPPGGSRLPPAQPELRRDASAAASCLRPVWLALRRDRRPPQRALNLGTRRSAGDRSLSWTPFIWQHPGGTRYKTPRRAVVSDFWLSEA
jgi:hypothetical protein